MKTIYLLFVLIILIWLPSCTQKCDCDLVYSNQTETGGLWFNSLTKKPYTGKCERLYGSGKIRQEVKFKEGKYIYEKFFYESGVVSGYVEYDANGARKTLTEYYGNEKKATEIIFKEGGVKSTEIGWYPNGNDSINYVWGPNGSLISQKEYYPNKQLKIDIQFNEGDSLVRLKTKDIEIEKEKTITPNIYFDFARIKSGSKVYYESGKIAAEIIEPIKYQQKKVLPSGYFPDKFSDYPFRQKSEIIFHSVYYLPNGNIYRIDVVWVDFIGDAYRGYISLLNESYDNISKEYSKNLKLEVTEDLQKCIEAIINNHTIYVSW